MHLHNIKFAIKPDKNTNSAIFWAVFKPYVYTQSCIPVSGDELSAYRHSSWMLLLTPEECKPPCLQIVGLTPVQLS